MNTRSFTGSTGIIVQAVSLRGRAGLGAPASSLPSPSTLLSWSRVPCGSQGQCSGCAAVSLRASLPGWEGPAQVTPEQLAVLTVLLGEQLRAVDVFYWSSLNAKE